METAQVQGRQICHDKYDAYLLHSVVLKQRDCSASRATGRR